MLFCYFTKKEIAFLERLFFISSSLTLFISSEWVIAVPKKQDIISDSPISDFCFIIFNC